MSDPERPSDQPVDTSPDSPTVIGGPVPSEPAGPAPIQPDAPAPVDPWAPVPSQPSSPAPTDPDAPPPGYSGGPGSSDVDRGFQPVQTPPAQPGPPWALALVAVLLVAVLGVLAFMLLTGGQDGPTPSPSPSVRPTAAGQLTPAPTPSERATAAPSSAATPGAGSPSASGSPAGPVASGLPSDIAAQIDLVVSQVPPIRQLEPERDVPYELITREQFQADVRELLAEETDPEQLATEERLLKRLGLLPPEFDLAAALEELYGSQVAAFYRPDTGRFYVIERDAPFGAIDRVTVAHEYTHALQDQHYDLEGTRIKDPAEGDAALAQLAVVEGDATAVMFDWALGNLSFEEFFELSSQSLSPTDQQILEDLPPILRRQLEFPYLGGLTFVDQLRGDDDWTAVNDALTEPPESTEQILHPDKYLTDELPIELELPDVSDALGDGWSSAYQQTMGELLVQIWAAGGEEPPVSIPGLPLPPPHAEVAAGWGGDRLAMYEGPNDGWAIVWSTAWDTEADAREFEVRANELMSMVNGPGQTLESRLGPLAVDVFIASDELTLATLTSPE